MSGIYVHIPFCESKCVYCAFSSFAGQLDKQQGYFEKLKEEILSSKFTFKVDSIFIGGGTPSAVDKNFIAEILSVIKSKFEVNEKVEITIEANPNSLDRKKLEFYKSIGINRLSIGVQSLDNKTLKKLGRLHNKAQVFKVLKEAKGAGFKNINCDLLLGLENESYNFLKKEINLLKKYATHFSCYMLQVEDDTPLKRMVLKGLVKLPPDEKTIENYRKLTKFLQKKGFFQYEISNFAKKGYVCQHNLNYWKRKNYLGFGLGAHSFMEEKRWANGLSFDKYFKGEKSFEETLTNRQKVEEIIMLGLRCYEGIDKRELLRYDYNIEENEDYKKFLEQKVLFLEGDKIKINPKFYGASNLVIERLI